MQFKHLAPIIATMVLTACSNKSIDNNVEDILSNSYSILNNPDIEWNVTGGYNKNGYSVGFNSGKGGIRLTDQDNLKQVIFKFSDGTNYQRLMISTGNMETNISTRYTFPKDIEVCIDDNANGCKKKICYLNESYILGKPAAQEELEKYLKIQETAFQELGPGTKNFEKRLKRR